MHKNKHHTWERRYKATVIAVTCIYFMACRLEKTGFSPEAEAQLERDRRSLNRPPEKELDINYTPHVNLHKIRQSDSFLNTTM